uniref:Flagellar protein FliT n=1 Tax=Rheinheimera sp. BAL341 TaxID=1708203 RepID=A0A486XWE2_9GAMM
MSLVSTMQRCQMLRQQIDQIVATELYQVELVSELSRQLFVLLQQPASVEEDLRQYAMFLQQNLDWLQALMAQLSQEKDTVAASILKVQQGRRARYSYGQQN